MRTKRHRFTRRRGPWALVGLVSILFLLAALTISYADESKDRSGPQLALTSHQAYQDVPAETEITLQGMATDAGCGGNGVQTITVEANGAYLGPAQNDTAGGNAQAEWSIDVPIIAGRNRIKIIACDDSPRHNATVLKILLYGRSEEVSDVSLGLFKDGPGDGQVKVGTVVYTLPTELIFAAFETVTLEAVPEENSAFFGWSGDLSDSENPTSILMDASKAITANFSQLPPDQPDDVPGQATLISPSGTIEDETPTYTWNEVESAAEYRLQVDDGATFDQWYDASSACSGGTCSVTPGESLEAGGHTWKVQARNEEGSGSWSGEMSFSLASPD